MQNSFFQAVCRVGIFMICAQAVVHFRPQEAYEKYLKLLVGIMVMIQLFWPIGGFLLGEGKQEAADILERFRQGLEQGMAEAEKRTAEAEAVLEQMTLEELRRHLEQQGEAEGQGMDGGGGQAADEAGGQDVSGRCGQDTEGAAQGAGGAEGQGMGGSGGTTGEGSGDGTDTERVTVDVEPVEPIRIPSSDRVP